MKMYIKPSFVHCLPDEGEYRWVSCNGENCGYERTFDDHTMGEKPLFRMFKVNGMQICEGCLNEWVTEIQAALED